VTALVIALPLLVALLFTALSLPAAKSGPHHVPLGITGPTPAVSAVTAALGARDADAFQVSRYADVDALRAAILDRDVYGGLAVDTSGTTVFTASGASPAIATTVSALETALGQQSGRPVTVEDLVPLPPGDPRGTGLAAAALPLTMAGVLPAILFGRAFPARRWVAAGGAAIAALTIGTAVAALLVWPLGAVASFSWSDVAVLAWGSAAISLTLLGLRTLLGTPGLGLGIVLVVLLGSPLSGLAGAPELLPAGWGAVGRLLPPGATSQALRSSAYFDGAGSGGPLLVLSCWVLAGLVLLGVARTRHPRPLGTPGPTD
jgi:hypothetical protein